jgi:4-hydroxy-3-methylbut-2-enyl diphosphate reductase
VCDFIRHDGDAEAFMRQFGAAASEGFDPRTDLERIGLANQTTMLMSESMAIGELFRQAMRDRHGDAALAERFRSFDTICSATQDRQDAIVSLLDEHPLDLAVVIGGYNSSNTCNLARICAERVPTYHIAGPDDLISAAEIRHRPVGTKTEAVTAGWLPAAGAVRIGLTSGASTPDNLMGIAIEQIARFCGEMAQV